MENMTAPAFLLSNQSARFIKAKSSASRDTEKLAHRDRRSDDLNRAIDNFHSTTDCAEALRSESSHVVLVLNVKCEPNIFRFHPEQRDIEETFAFE